MTVTSRLNLACEAVEVPHGVRLLCSDGRSFLVRGIGRDALFQGRLPPEILRVMRQLGVLRPVRPTSVAVVGSGPLAGDVAEAVRSVPGALVIEMGDGSGRHRPGGHWSLLGEPGSRLRPDLVVVCPRDPLGLREPVHLCQHRGIPVLVGWAGTAGAWLGPVSLPTRPGCQDCLDVGMARRDPLWAHTAAGLGGAVPGWAPRHWLADSICQLVESGPQSPGWRLSRWASWTSRVARSALLDPVVDCPRCQLRADSAVQQAAV